MNPILNYNRRAWDERVQRRMHHTRTASDQVFEDPATMADIHGWIGRDLKGKRVLCLGAGGGRHGPLYAAAGANVVVLDLSPKMLELDRAVAAQRGLTVRTLEGSMDDLGMLESSTFDLVIQPVSTCYVPEILQVYQEVARICVPGGLYVSQHKQPTNLQAAASVSQSGRYAVLESYYRNGPLPEVPPGSLHREPGCLEFLHRWEELVGGLCRSGFVLEDLLEPRHANPNAPVGSFQHRSCFIPPYVALKARRIDCPEDARRAPKLWTPS